MTRVGAVSPHASLSDFSGDWIDGTAAGETNLLYSDPPTRESAGLIADYKLKPVRFEFGMAARWNTLNNISGRQRNIGPRDTAPPTSTGGHLESIDVTSIVVPSAVFCRTQFTDFGNGQSSVLRAIGISKNGTHVAIVDLGTTVPIYFNGSASISYKQHSEQTIAVSMTLVETDTIQVDYYVHAIASTLSGGRPVCVNFPAATNYAAILVADGTMSAGGNITGVLTFNSVQSRVDDATGHKVIFSNKYPGGLSEISFGVVPSGWTSSAFAGGLRLDKSDGTYIVTFGWMQEIPYLEILKSGASPAMRVRYRPVASGDYDTIDVAVTSGTWTQEYGVWKYDELNPYTNRAAQITFTSGDPWYSDDEYAAAFSGFPEFVIIAPTTVTSDLYTSGSGTWSSPINGYVLIEYQAPGGGGGAGEDGSNAGGSGGGGGGFGSKVLSVTNTDTISYSVGSVGTKGTYPNDDATDGGNTTVAGGTYTAVGGKRGRGQGNGSIVGAGGTASGGDVSETGASGSARSGNNGGAGGQGANSGGLGGTAGVSTTTDGGTGSNYGGGGGGGGKEKDGGNGGSGFVRFTYFI